MKRTITFNLEEREELVKQIINDSVMWERMIIGMTHAQRSFNPNREEWEPGSWFNGLFNAFPLLGFPSPKTIEDEKKVLPITDRLRDIFEHAIKEDLDRELELQRTADALAEHILVDWKKYLNRIRLEGEVPSTEKFEFSK